MRVEVPLAANFECDLDGSGQSARQRSYIRNGYVITLPDGSKMVKKRAGFITETLTNTVTSLYQSPGNNQADLISIGGGASAWKAYYTKPGLAINQTLIGNVAALSNNNDIPTLGFDFCDGPNGASATNPIILILGISNAYYVLYNAGDPASTSAALAVTSSNRSFGAVCLDNIGYLPSTLGRITNSAAGDLTSWPALNTIKMQRESEIRGIAKHHGHIVAWSDLSMEVYYNAGNPTGSILSRRSDLTQSIGATRLGSQSAAGRTVNYVCDYMDSLFFLGGPSNSSGVLSFANGGTQTSVPPAYAAFGVWTVENFRARKISTPYIDTLLSGANISGMPTMGINGILLMDNKPFLVVTYDFTNSKCAVYDLEEKLWYLWDLKISGAIAGNYFLSSIETTSLNHFNNFSSNGRDNGTDFSFSVTTVKIDQIEQSGDSMGRLKTADTFRIMANRPAQSTPLKVSYSDDDYQTFSTAKEIDLGSYERVLPDQGAFRERAYKLEYTGPSIIQLNQAVLDMAVGTG